MSGATLGRIALICSVLLVPGVHGASFAMHKAENCEAEKAGARVYHALDVCLIENKKYFKVTCTEKKVIVSTYEDTGCTKEKSKEKNKIGCSKKGLWSCNETARPLPLKMYKDTTCSDPPGKYSYVPENLCHAQGGALGQVWWKYVCIDGRMEKFEYSAEGCKTEDKKQSTFVAPAGGPGDQCQVYSEKYGVDHGCDDGGQSRTSPGAKDKPKDDGDDEL